MNFYVRKDASVTAELRTEPHENYYYAGHNTVCARVMTAKNVTEGMVYCFIFEDWMVEQYGTNRFEVLSIEGEDIRVLMLDCDNDEDDHHNTVVLSSGAYWVINSYTWEPYEIVSELEITNYTSVVLDNVNHPSHYAGDIECKDAMIQQFGAEAYKTFCQLNAFKYIWRSNMKHETPDEDLDKANWYLTEYKKLSQQAK